MIDLTKFKGITSGELIVRHSEDDSGDHTLHYYSVVAVKSWGTRTICDDIDNPHDAEMFASAPEMIQEIIKLRAEVLELEKCISKATINLLGEEEINKIPEQANAADNQPAPGCGENKS